jgi:cationic peptide transport system permease protein
MIQHLLRRLNLLCITIIMLCIVSFLLAYLFPGDSLTNLSGVQNPDNELIEKYAADQSLMMQFGRYLTLLAQGDGGISFSSQKDLLSEVWFTLPATLELIIYALGISVIFGIPLGLISGFYRNKLPDNAIRVFSVVGYSIPVFWLALILIIFLALNTSAFPISGRISLLYDIPHYSGFILYDIAIADINNKSRAMGNALLHLILPTCSIALITTSSIVRNIRRSTVEVMEQEYINAAFGKGLTQPQVFWRHGIRNALLPILPIISIQFTILLTNAMIIEVIFSWPGIGNWLIQAIYQRDYPAIRVGMLVVSSSVVLFTVVMDVLIRMLHPMKEKVSYGSI